VLDLRGVSSFTDFFVICSGTSEPHLKAIAAAIYDEVHRGLKHEVRLLPASVDGQREASWIVADYLDVVLHVFTPEARKFYDLEDLWGDAPRLEWESAQSAR